jgi:hypothetical protein
VARQIIVTCQPLEKTKHYLNLRLTLAEYYDMVLKAFRGGKLRKAFLIYRSGRENVIAGGLDSGELQVYTTWFIFLNIEDMLDVG